MDTNEIETKECSPWQPITDSLTIKFIGKLIEELGESSSALARCLIQGLDEKIPGKNKTNREWLEDEIADVRTFSDLIVEFLNLDHVKINDRITKKKKFVGKWLSLGTECNNINYDIADIGIDIEKNSGGANKLNSLFLNHVELEDCRSGVSKLEQIEIHLVADVPLGIALADIISERIHQKQDLNFTPEEDSKLWKEEELLKAAACFMLIGTKYESLVVNYKGEPVFPKIKIQGFEHDKNWCWEEGRTTELRNKHKKERLVITAALIIAELERMSFNENSENQS